MMGVALVVIGALNFSQKSRVVTNNKANVHVFTMYFLMMSRFASWHHYVFIAKTVD